MTAIVAEISYVGEDGEWIFGPGHMDLAEFTAKADQLARDLAQIDEHELPSGYDDARHTHLRVDPDRPDYFMFCNAEDDGAEPVTYILTGA